MRKIEMKTKILMIIFSICVVLIGTGFIVAISAINQKTRTELLLKEGSVLFVDTRKLVLEEASYIKENIKGQWQLTTSNSKETLGKNIVIYDQSKMIILGGGYQIFEDQTVQILDKVHEVNDLKNESFYKLQDRRYVFIADMLDVIDEKEASFNQFIYIALDKAGYGQIYNVDKMMKTTKELEVKATIFSFNISREILKTANSEADLKRIYGTTSTFLATNTNDQDLLNTELQEDNPEVIDLTISGGDGGKGGKGGAGGLGGSGGIGGGGGTGVAGGGSGTTVEARKSMQFKTITAGFDKLTIEYLIIDPLAQYGVTWLYVYEETNPTTSKLVDRINIDPMGQYLLVQNLKPDTQYSLKLGYTSEDTEADDDFAEQDGIKSMTKQAKATIQLVMQENKKLVFNVKLNKDYVPDSLKLKLIDAENEMNITGNVYEINIGQATSETGYTLNIEFDNSNIKTLQLVVEEAMKNGTEITFGGYATFYNKFYK